MAKIDWNIFLISAFITIYFDGIFHFLMDILLLYKMLIFVDAGVSHAFILIPMKFIYSKYTYPFIKRDLVNIQILFMTNKRNKIHKRKSKNNISK